MLRLHVIRKESGVTFLGGRLYVPKEGHYLLLRR